MTNSLLLMAKHVLLASRMQIAFRNATIPSHTLPDALSIVQCFCAIGGARGNRCALPLAFISVAGGNGADVGVGAGDSLSHADWVYPRSDGEADGVLSIRWGEPCRPPWRKSVREDKQADKEGAAKAENNRCPRRASWKLQLAYCTRQVEPHLDVTRRRSPSVECSNSVRHGLPATLVV